MTTYRTGNHHGITIVAENDGARCAREGHDCERGHLVAVVVDGGEELAERICALLNADEPEPEIKVTKYAYTQPLADGKCTHGRVVHFNLAVGYIEHIVDGTRCTGEVI